MLSQRIRKRYYKTLVSSVINSPCLLPPWGISLQKSYAFNDLRICCISSILLRLLDLGYLDSSEHNVPKKSRPTLKNIYEFQQKLDKIYLFLFAFNNSNLLGNSGIFLSYNQICKIKSMKSLIIDPEVFLPYKISIKSWT